MAAWTNATLPRGDVALGEPTTRGVLRRAETERVAALARDTRISPELEPFVERYWTVSWDRTGQAPFRSEVLSHPSVNLTVEDGDEPRFGVPMPAVLVHGVVTRRFQIDLVGRGRVAGVKFHPGGWTALTGLPTTRDTVVRVPAGLGLDAARLLEEVLDAPDWAARLDTALRPLAGVPSEAYTDLRGLLARAAADRSVQRVEDLAALAGTSVRAVQRLFARYVGTTPKHVLARYRLQHATAAMDAGEVDDLAELAASLGWFDQAHFTRDFRAVVGTTPAVYLRQVTPPAG